MTEETAKNFLSAIPGLKLVTRYMKAMGRFVLRLLPISPRLKGQLRSLRAQKQKMYGMGMKKLNKIADVESSLCRAVRIRNTVLRISELSVDEFGEQLQAIAKTPFNETVDCKQPNQKEKTLEEDLALSDSDGESEMEVAELARDLEASFMASRSAHVYPNKMLPDIEEETDGTINVETINAVIAAVKTATSPTKEGHCSTSADVKLPNASRSPKRLHPCMYEDLGEGEPIVKKIKWESCAEVMRCNL